MSRTFCAEWVESKVRAMASQCSLYDKVVMQETWMAQGVTMYCVGMNAGCTFYLGVDCVGAVYEVAFCVGEYDSFWTAVEYVGSLSSVGYIGHY